ncbi:coiled-coil domain-containing protein [Arenibacter aquaticus]|uniref:hypothetical protein n=1 Tax=Arenibacter aquaticus TaxID=2489054 RepID=UPI0013049A79|nr:hypothetical protein [Arenibacter aquaticus]
MFKWKSGLSNKEASVLIGKHFPDVDDKLYNLLDLADSADKSELLLASIEQRSLQLANIPFVNAIDFKDNLKYAKYVLIPFLIVALLWVSGEISSFFGSYKRVVNYNMAYEPPAPFSFELLTSNLSVYDDVSYTLQVRTSGRLRPDDVFIVVNNKKFLMEYKEGYYEYVFKPPHNHGSFYFIGNDVRSKNYVLNVIDTPVLLDFEMELDYPEYTNLPKEVIKGTGNATVPEGTQVNWNIKTRYTDRVNLHLGDSVVQLKRGENVFSFSKSVLSDTDYEVSTSNEAVNNYEILEYRLKVIKDAFPTIRVEEVLDSLNPNLTYYVGEVSDDYGLSAISLVVYSEEDMEDRQVLELLKGKGNLETFYYTFPSGLNLNSGTNYEYYFEVADNDGINGGKFSKSQVFSTRLLNSQELNNKRLDAQKAVLGNMAKGLKESKEQQNRLRELTKEQKESSGLNFSQQNKIREFLRKQGQQEELMKNFRSQLKSSLEKGEEDEKLNRLLQERLERQELEAKKNEQLLKELNELAKKLDKEELARRLDELGKRSKNSDRNLEQLLELTKRYYVQQKAKELATKLENMAGEQLSLISEEFERKRDSLRQEQKKLSIKYDDVAKELKEWRKDNNSLNKPIGINVDSKKLEDTKSVLEEINEELSKKNASDKGGEPAKTLNSKQRFASKKLKEMAEGLKESASGGGGNTQAEDAEMLRQLLDNLITFSFKQEILYDALGRREDLGVVQSDGIKKQQELLELFGHVDDSLFALSLRQAELSEFVNEQITEVYYNMEKVLDNLAENELYQAGSYQKYVLTAANSLADFLAEVLDNMQQDMSAGSGKGKGEGFQLPDIIAGQQELKNKMGKMGSKGSDANKGEHGNEGQQGEKGKEGDSGQDGKSGKDGEGGKDGESGQDGESGSDGEGGREGSGNGNNGEANTGLGDKQGGSGPSEEELREIYEIYKEQQAIKEHLEEQLKNMLNNSDRKLGEKLVKQMEDFQNELLRSGVTEHTVNRVNTINRELLKLENAAMKQGEKKERESNQAKDVFLNPILTKPSLLENYRNEQEILNRQALPLQQNFQIKVKEYFKVND